MVWPGTKASQAIKPDLPNPTAPVHQDEAQGPDQAPTARSSPAEDLPAAPVKAVAQVEENGGGAVGDGLAGTVNESDSVHAAHDPDQADPTIVQDSNGADPASESGTPGEKAPSQPIHNPTTPTRSADHSVRGDT